jgi:ATP-dependent Lon protease
LIDAVKALASEDFGLAQEDSRRLAALKRLSADFMGAQRKLLGGSTAIVERLTKLKETAPSFAPVIDLIAREARASMLSGGAMQITPLILVGPPGFGKTHTARQIALALGVPFEAISMNTCDSPRGELCGYGLQWKGSREGRVARTLLGSHTASALVLVDEIEKAAKSDRGEDPSHVWLTFFERENAAEFSDAYLNLKLRADFIFWVATANSLDGIPAPVLDRALVVHIEAPAEAERHALARSVVQNVIANRGGGDANLGDDAYAVLAQHPPRTMTKLLQLAAGFAAERGSARISARDLAQAEQIALGLAVGRRFGFL